MFRGRCLATEAKACKPTRTLLKPSHCGIVLACLLPLPDRATEDFFARSMGKGIRFRFLITCIRKPLCLSLRQKLLASFICVVLLLVILSQFYVDRFHSQYFSGLPVVQSLHGLNSSLAYNLFKWTSKTWRGDTLEERFHNNESQTHWQRRNDHRTILRSRYVRPFFAVTGYDFYPQLLTPIHSRNQYGQNGTVFRLNQTLSFEEVLKSWLSLRPYKSSRGIGFTLNHPQICGNKGVNVTLLVAVTSSVSHAESRLAIRDTWGGYAKERGAKVLFVVGIPKHPKYRSRLASEDLKFHDIVQGNFLDTYNNLTVKSVSLLKWVSEFCSEVKYVLKVDDDMFINVEKFLELTTNHNASKTIMGQLAHGWPPVRSSKSKWYSPFSAYPFTKYPDFVFGPAYLMTGDSAKVLYETSLQIPFFHLEDVYVTGMVAEQAGVKRINQTGMFNSPRDLQPCNFQRIFSSHGHTPPDMRRHWMWLKRRGFKCIQ